MHTVEHLILKRVDRFVRERLMRAVHRERISLTMSAWTAPGEPVPFSEAFEQEFTPFPTGSRWGAPWGTTWFRTTGVVPRDWALDGFAVEARFDLGFSEVPIQPEALAYRPDGTVVKSVSYDNRSIPLSAAPGTPFELYLEGASNPDTTGGDDATRPTRLGVPEARELGELYTFAQAELVLRDLTVWNLWQDAVVLRQLVDVLPEGSPRRARVVRALDALVDLVDPEDVSGTAAEGRALLEPVLTRPAHASAHTLFAVGHAHIDSAWLWPARETRRKIARTFANALAQMDADPDFVFAASSAQQYAWLAEDQPELFERVRERVAEGRFVPVGSMWVEADTNLPGGEAFARQLIHGKRFFREQFGVDTRDVWLPDSFGYSGALPQIARAAGAEWFFGQKLSWNEVNRMPHHTFIWEGIDGTGILTHFTPADRYDARVLASELAHTETGFAESAVSDSALFAFGYGDGGGGPTREMVARAHRFADLEGVPRVRMASPNAFFEDAAADVAELETWFGEMYLEFHRGTYASQARGKRGNRRSEHLLREAELWAATAAIRVGEPYPYDELDRAWRLVLLNQFHDILTGTSIGWVHRQAEAEHTEVARIAEQIIESSLAAVAGRGDRMLIADAAPFPIGGAPALGIGVESEASAVIAERSVDGGMLLTGDLVRVHVRADGTIDSLCGADGREAIAPGGRGNLLRLSRDTPKQWDAWDVDREYRRHERDLLDVVSIGLVEDVPRAPRVRIERAFGVSRVVQEISLLGDAVDIVTEVDWHERQKLLKLVFQLDVQADRSAAETQFGHVFRAMHRNTSWDAARFEICAHRWVHVGEPGYGVAIGNDASYGHDISRERLDGRAITRVGQSLVRAPLFPDPEADQGAHRFRTTVRPGSGIADAVRLGYATNLPPRRWSGAAEVGPLVELDGEGVMVESVKLADDRGGDLIVRLYEAHGTRASVRLRVAVPHAGLVLTDLLEDAVDEVPVEDGAFGLEFGPFQLRTLRIRRPNRLTSEP